MPKSTILEWKDKLINEAQTLLIPAHEKDKQVKKLNETISELHKMIGEMPIENTFLKLDYQVFQKLRFSPIAKTPYQQNA